MIALALSPSDDWRKGFLAGIFDAEGSLRRERRCGSRTPTRLILDWINVVPPAFRLRSVVEQPARPNGVHVRSDPRRPPRTPALLPPDRPSDHAQARRSQGMALKSDAKTARGQHRAARHGDAPVRHHDRHRRLHRQRRGQPQLLRPPDPHVPRLQRRPRLREGDRRQGQRARGAARRAGAAVVEGRARRDGDQHRPVPVGRGALQAHARDLGGAARRGQPVLGADEVAAAAARPRPDEGDRRRSPTSARTCRCRRSTRRRGGRASRTRPTRARGWRPSPSSTGRASRPASWSRR